MDFGGHDNDNDDDIDGDDGDENELVRTLMAQLEPLDAPTTKPGEDSKRCLHGGLTH